MDRSKIQIANPCSENFDEMSGEGAKRFCDSCDKHVHNLSDMTREEARKLLRDNKEAGICVVYMFDESNRVRFRDDLNFRRPSKGQLRGLKKLLAAAAMVPVLATLPACDPSTYEEPAAIEQPCDVNQSGYKPLDDIIAAERAFTKKLHAFLGFGPGEGPEVEMLAGAPVVDPAVYEPPPLPVVDRTPDSFIMGEVEPQMELPKEQIVMGDWGGPAPNTEEPAPPDEIAWESIVSEGDGLIIY